MWNVEIVYWTESAYRTVPGGSGYRLGRDAALAVARRYLGGDAQRVRIVNAYGSVENLK